MGLRKVINNKGYLLLWGVLLLFICNGKVNAVEPGYDMGYLGAQDALEKTEVFSINAPWMRIRYVWRVKGDKEGVTPMREALGELQQRGYKILALLRWSPDVWLAGSREGDGHRLPVDLMEAFERCRYLGRELGDVVTAWEIENEPDIGYVKDPAYGYAAFLKACYLGFRAGDRDRGDGKVSAVWLAGPALPPGPYFLQLVDNGLWGYTDAFTFHYYGYADDFSGTCEQWERALVDVGASELPRVVTEYGDGLMAYEERNLSEVRVKQKEWFLDVLGQMDELPVDAAMAFVMRPNNEVSTGREFGLIQKLEGLPFDGVATPALEALNARPMKKPAERSFVPRERKVSKVVLDLMPDPEWRERANGVGYLVSGQGLREESGVRSQNSEDSQRNEEGERCPDGVSEVTVVVYNFSEETIRGRVMVPEGVETQFKLTADGEVRGNSKVPMGASSGSAAKQVQKEGADADVVYNAEEIRGVKPLVSIPKGVIEVPAMSSVRIPVKVDVRGVPFGKLPLRLCWVEGTGCKAQGDGILISDSDGAYSSEMDAWGHASLPYEGAPEEPVAVLQTAVIPYDPGMSARVLWAWRSPQWKAWEPHELPWKRLPEEPELLVSSVGWGTRGVLVQSSSPGRLKVQASQAPEVSLHPVRVELALPDDFSWEKSQVLAMRLSSPNQAEGKVPRFRLGIRCESGQVYGLWQRIVLPDIPRDFAWLQDEMTPQFYSRASGDSWRFEDQKPVALVLHLYAEEYPCTLEVDGIRVMEYGAPRDGAMANE